LGLALPDCQIHAPNESFTVSNFEAGIRLNRALLEELARLMQSRYNAFEILATEDQRPSFAIAQGRFRWLIPRLANRVIISPWR
jgi:hypothetical protein